MATEMTSWPDTAGFLGELTELTLKYGLAIAGNPEVFVLEPEDRANVYVMDEQSRITFGTKNPGSEPGC